MEIRKILISQAQMIRKVKLQKIEVITYVTGIELIKIDGANKDRLVGAEFEISGEKINKVKGFNG